jgi:hypothetical protein
MDLNIFMKDNILIDQNFIVHFVPKLVDFTFNIVSKKHIHFLFSESNLLRSSFGLCT